MSEPIDTLRDELSQVAARVMELHRKIYALRRANEETSVEASQETRLEIENRHLKDVIAALKLTVNTLCDTVTRMENDLKKEGQ